MKSYWMRIWTFMIFVAIGLGLGACSNVALKDQTSLTSGSLSQTNEATTNGGVNTNDSHSCKFGGDLYR